MGEPSKIKYSPFNEVKKKVLQGMKEDEAISSASIDLVNSVGYASGNYTPPDVTSAMIASELMTAIIGYIYYNDEPEAQNIEHVISLLEKASNHRNHPDAREPELTYMIKYDYASREPDAFAVKAFSLYNMAPARYKEDARAIAIASIWCRTCALATD